MSWFSIPGRGWVSRCPLCRCLFAGAVSGWLVLAPAAAGNGPVRLVIQAPGGETLPPPRPMLPPTGTPTVAPPLPSFPNGGSMRAAPPPVTLPAPSGSGYGHHNYLTPPIVVHGEHNGEGHGPFPMAAPEQQPLYGQPNISSHPSDPSCKHWLHVDNCSSIPKGTLPAPRGTFLNAAREIQAAKAEADDFVFYKHEWCREGIQLGPYGTYHLREVIRRLGAVPFQVILEPEVDNQVNLARRTLIVQRLLTAGIHDAEQRVVIAFPAAEGLYGDEALRIYYALISPQNALGNNFGRGNFGFGNLGGFGGGFGGFGFGFGR